MSTIIYLSNQQVQIIIGTSGNKSISVKSMFQEEAPEGSIINGMIMDVELFTGFLKDLWTNKKLPTKDVSLVISTSKFIGKNLDIPKMNDKKMISFIDREYKDMGRDSQLTYSYIVLPGSSKQNVRVYAEGIEPDFIKEYVDIFSSFGVKLKAVYSGEGSLINMVSKTIAKNCKTFVAVFADKITLTTVLWVNGEFSYYNTSRCFHAQGTIEHAEDMARTISQVSQFMQAHQMEHALERIVLAGLESTDLELYTEVIHDIGITAPVEVFKQSYINTISDIHEYIHATSGLFSNTPYQNALLHLQSFKKKEDGEAKSYTALIGIGACLAAMIFIWIAFMLVRQQKQNELLTLQEYNSSPLVIGQTMEYDSLVNRNSFLRNQYNAVDGLNKNLLTYPRGNDIVINRILACSENYAELTFSSFNSEAGSISMVAKSTDVDKINQFIKKLMTDDIFKDVNYTGYAFNEQDQLWDIHVTCILNESVGIDVVKDEADGGTDE